MKRGLAVIVAVVLAGMLAGCVGYGGSQLVPGQASQEDVVHAMGAPAMQWTNADGSRQLAYPRGPTGVHTYMAYIGPDGKLQRIENALTADEFMRLQPGMSSDQVLRLLGPSDPAGTRYFPARDELVWEWRYCDVWAKLARFDVLLDGTHKTVRSMMSVREDQIGKCGGVRGDGCWCAH